MIKFLGGFVNFFYNSGLLFQKTIEFFGEFLIFIEAACHDELVSSKGIVKVVRYKTVRYHRAV